MAPTLPAPITWTPGTLVKAPELRAEVSDTVALMCGPPAFYGGKTISSQNIGYGTITAISIDTEFWDPWNGHRNSVNTDNWYAPLAGYYLAESCMPMDGLTSGGVSAGILATENGTSTSYMGQLTLPTGGFVSAPVAAKLVKQENIGYGTGDYIAAAAWQAYPAGGANPLATNVTARRFPFLTTRWVCALTGTAGLPVPVNASWPAPPAYLTAAFANTSLRDTINFLIYPPVMEWTYIGSSQSVASQTAVPATGATINLNTKTFDNYSAYNNSTNTWTAPVSGVYYCYAQLVLFGGVNSRTIAAGLTVSSANYNSGTAFTYWGGTQAALAENDIVSSAVVRRQLRLNAGDTVKMAGFQYNSAASGEQVQGTSYWTTRMITIWEAA